MDHRETAKLDGREVNFVWTDEPPRWIILAVDCPTAEWNWAPALLADARLPWLDADQHGGMHRSADQRRRKLRTQAGEVYQP
jgi:hypothetical protein